MKQSGVSHIRVIHREQDDGRNTVALGKRWRVRRGHDGSTTRRRTEGHTAFREAAHVAEPVCPNEPTEEHGMWDGGGLHATDDDEKMDEDKEETDTEEIRDEEQEEEHQKARAIASPDLPSRREVEDDNLTHLPFRSWRYHFLRFRGRRSGHRRRHNEGQMQREARQEKARRWGDRSSWRWTGKPEECTHTM